MTRVLVTDAGRGSGMAILRSLGRRGVHVVAADANERSPGFSSRYSAASVVYPYPATHPAEAVDVLVDAAERHRVDLVLPVGEDVVVLLSDARDRFAGIASLALPDADALAVVRDKAATFDLANRLEVPAPGTRVVTTVEEALAAAPELGWPIVLKPRSSRIVRGRERVEAFGVAYAVDADALAEKMKVFEGRSAVLLQEYCSGEGHGVGVLMNGGDPLLAFQHRRLREVPFTGGPSSFRESVALDPTLLDYSVRMLKAIGWTGPAMAEFKVRSGDAKLMEINGRLWGSLALAVKSGVDIPFRMLDLFLSDPAANEAPVTEYKLGVRSRDLGLEVAWIASVLAPRPRNGFPPAPRRRDAIAAAARLLDPRDGFDVLSLHDPRPGFVEVFNTATHAVRRLGRRRRYGTRAAVS